MDFVVALSVAKGLKIGLHLLCYSCIILDQDFIGCLIKLTYKIILQRINAKSSRNLNYRFLQFTRLF